MKKKSHKYFFLSLLENAIQSLPRKNTDSNANSSQSNTDCMNKIHREDLLKLMLLLKTKSATDVNNNKNNATHSNQFAFN